MTNKMAEVMVEVKGLPIERVLLLIDGFKICVTGCIVKSINEKYADIRIIADNERAEKMAEIKFQRNSGPEAVTEKLSTIGELADVMLKAGLETWVEGLGQPQCYYDVAVWQKIGEMIKRFI